MSYRARKGSRVGSTSIAAMVGGSVLATSAAAQDATWSATPVSNDVLDPANWTPVPPGVANTAFLDGSTVTTLVNTGLFSLGGITLNAGAPDYTLVNASMFQLQGAGVAINGVGDY